MERLTKHDTGCMSSLRKAVDPCRDVCNSRGTDCFDDCPIQEAIDRLADYEDTGMDPEEVAAREDKIKQAFSNYIKRMASWHHDEQTTKTNRSKVAFAAIEIERLYAQIFGISFDEAAKELHKDDNEKA